jgi:hypothetical protein
MHTLIAETLKINEEDIFKPATTEDIKQRAGIKLYADMKDVYADWSKKRLKPKILSFADCPLKTFIVQHTPKQVGHVVIGSEQNFKRLENVKELGDFKWGNNVNTFYSASYKDYDLLVWYPQTDYKSDYYAYVWPKQLSEAEIFKPVTKEEVYARQVSRFKKLDISKFETRDDYVKAMQPPYIRLWDGIYPEDERLRFDTVFAYGAVPGIQPSPHLEYIWHAIEVVSNKETGKLLAVWDLGEYNDAGDAESALHGFSPKFIIDDLKLQGLIEARDIFKPISDEEVAQRYALNPHKLIKITSLDQLKQLASGETAIDVRILIGGGMIRSSKRVSYDPVADEWWIFSYMDDSETSAIEDTNILQAIEKGTLIYDPASNESIVSERDIFQPASDEDIKQREETKKMQWVDRFMGDRFMSDLEEHPGYVFYRAVSNAEELHNYYIENGDLPDSESFQKMEAGDEALAKAHGGFIATEIFAFSEEEWNQVPKTLKQALGINEANIFKPASDADCLDRSRQQAAVYAAERAAEKAKKVAYYASIPYTYEQITALPQYKKIMALDNGLSTSTADRETVKDLTSDIMKKHKSTKFRLIYGWKDWNFKDYFVRANGYISTHPIPPTGYNSVLRSKDKGAATTLAEYGGLLDDLYKIMVRKLQKHGVKVS